MILLDAKDRRPIYEQITEKLADLMLKGILPKDAPLPSVRNLAADLSINPNTVQRAYMELERQGYIYSIKAKGSFVADTEPLKGVRSAAVMKEFEGSVLECIRAGISSETLMKKISDLYQEA